MGTRRPRFARVKGGLLCVVALRGLCYIVQGVVGSKRKHKNAIFRYRQIE